MFGRALGSETHEMIKRNSFPLFLYPIFAEEYLHSHTKNPIRVS